ncbi:hypothetical protein CEXT_519251 [Caerostris extrusa]|uniref:Uncharacterized protein n=1 Tax=Caerostris extrusa TaxID=172846 RepID=A0AAV4THK4_CAEEX|nr:hypothetical protein CEXT_519251 [Caerostris extrusa]
MPENCRLLTFCYRSPVCTADISKHPKAALEQVPVATEIGDWIFALTEFSSKTQKNDDELKVPKFVPGMDTIIPIRL